MIARLARLAVAGALLLASPAATSTPVLCSRQTAPEDVRLEIKGDVATIVIQNLRDKCGIRFVPLPRWVSDTNMTMGTVVQLRAAGGEDLTATNAADPEGMWWSPRKRPRRVVLRRPHLTIWPGESYRQPVYLAYVARDIAAARTANGLPDLPWGQVISIRMNTIVHCDFKLVSIDDSISFPKEFEPLTYRLPPRRPD